MRRLPGLRAWVLRQDSQRGEHVRLERAERTGTVTEPIKPFRVRCQVAISQQLLPSTGLPREAQRKGDCTRGLIIRAPGRTASLDPLSLSNLLIRLKEHNHRAWDKVLE